MRGQSPQRLEEMEKMVTSLSLFRKHGYGSSSVPVVITVRGLTFFPKNILKSESDVDLYLNVIADVSIPMCSLLLL